jgi:hypothetical protein
MRAEQPYHPSIPKLRAMSAAQKPCVAASHHYFVHLNGVKPIASAALVVLLWPLVLFGVSLHLK